MTAQELQDALTFLPDDLIEAADRRRTAPRKLPWRRMLPLAACFALLLGIGLLANRTLGGAKSEAEAPTAMAPAQAADTAVPQEAPAQENFKEESAAEEELTGAAAAGNMPAGSAQPDSGRDHHHGFAEESEAEMGTAHGWCGNTQVTITLNGETYVIGGSDAIAVAAILEGLDYDPGRLCRCMAPITVDTELLTGIQINLEQGFARCEQGQADLTESQAQTIRDILNRLG